MTCGIAVGARAIGVATGGFSGSELQEYSPCAVFDDLSATARVMEAIHDA
jgi:phosphoglycolate phosphatase-like HAD superfamily hydrolase